MKICRSQYVNWKQRFRRLDFHLLGERNSSGIALRKAKIDSEKCGLIFNKKTKGMLTSLLREFAFDNEEVKVVYCFVFWHSIIDKDRQHAREVKRRLIQGRKAATNLDKGEGYFYDNKDQNS